MTIDPTTAAAEISTEAFAANIGAISELVAPVTVMVVAKADGYGHGLLTMTAAARAAGAAWLGVAVPGEARAVRAAGDRGRLFCWLYGPGEDLTDLVAADVDLGVSSIDELARIVAAGRRAGRAARIHLKIDTGLTRSGAPAALWPRLCASAATAEDAGDIEVVGLWSHLATAEDPEHRSVASQIARFDEAVAVAHSYGLKPELRHLANSAGALGLPKARYEMVRGGIAAYGVDPGVDVAERAGITLRPVMTLVAHLVQVKAIAAGTSVSYGHTWTADRDTCVGLVPIGYADGLLRHAGNAGTVTVNGRAVPIVGRVCMDQCLVDLGPQPTDRVGDRVVVFGAGGQRANDLAAACGTVGYEIVTRIGPRLRRVLTSGKDAPIGTSPPATTRRGD
ncbi:MAG: alanine racemase [Propionibacteriales bacterium]|nr:alanine racemase [Propionibacteriales bacterium]